MNISRGLFRLWIILAVLFVFLVIIFNLDDLKHPTSKFDSTTAKLMLPVDCSLVRGKLDKDYSTNLKGNYCWYQISVFRKLFPEYKDLQDTELSEKLYKKVNIKSQPDNHLFWNAVQNILIYGLGIPLLLLALGFCLKWALAGFRNN